MSGVLTALGSILVSAGSGPITPPDVAGLSFWVKADALVLSDNDPVSHWLDSSGTGITLDCNTNQPIYKTNIVNSLPVVRLSSSTNAFVSSSSIAVSQPNTTFLVLKKTGSNDGRIYDSSDRQLLNVDATTNTGTMYAGGSSGATGTASLATSFHVFCGIFNGTSSLSWVDGTADITSASGFGTAGITTLYVGADNSGGAKYDGDLAELIVYNSALSTGNRHGIQNYLGTKYNITIS